MSNKRLSANSSSTNHERRADTRLRLTGMQVRARRHRLGRLRGYEDCIPVDLSINGLALRSAKLELELLEKADIILTINQRNVHGTGLVCYKSKEGDLTQYGLLFLRTSHAIESVLECDETNRHSVLEFARKTAELTAQRVSNSQSTAVQDTYRRMLCDAAETFARHLTDALQCRPKITNQGRLPSIDDFLEIDRLAGTVRFRRSQSDNRSVETVTIQVTDVAPGEQPSYIVRPDDTLASVYEVIELIGEAYASLVD